MPAYSLSALERYQDCPFKFFAADVLRLEEAAGRRVDAVAAGARPLHPRSVSAVLRSVGCAAATARSRQPARAGPGSCCRGGRAAAGEAARRRCRARTQRGCSDRLSRSAWSTSCLDRGVASASTSRAAGSSTGSRGSSRSAVADATSVPLQGRRRPHRPAGWPPAARHRLQVGLGARIRRAHCRCRSTRSARRSDWRSATAQPWPVDEAAYVAFSGQANARAGRQGRQRRRSIGARATRARGCFDGRSTAIARGEFPPRPHDR